MKNQDQVLITTNISTPSVNNYVNNYVDNLLLQHNFRV